MSPDLGSVRTADGRDLETLIEGADDGLLLVFHHGSPGAVAPFEGLDVAARELGIRVVSYSRPGYGGSSRHEGRSVADCAPDVAAIADHLGVERFVTAGWSGGGPHALATAALLPDRTLAVSTIAGVAPWDADGLDWTAGMGKDNQIEYTTAARDPEELLRWMQPQIEAMRDITPAEIVSAMRSLISGVDEQAVNDALGELLAAEFRSAFREGPWGWYDDDLAYTRPWGFELDAVGVPVAIWQGAQDLMVPFAHGEWLAAHLPTAEPRLRPEHGHLSLAVGSLGEILEDLVALAGR